MKYIKSFYFQSAKYLVSDEKGNSLYMIMNYRENRFKIELVSGEAKNLQEEVKMVANKLLKKKHNVNFVERLEV